MINSLISLVNNEETNPAALTAIWHNKFQGLARASVFAAPRNE